MLRRHGIPRFEAKKTADAGEIHVYDVVGDSWYGITAKQVVEALDRFRRDGVKRIDVFVNSPGGSAFDGVAIFNALRRFDGQKTVYIDGVAASAASVIALAGDRIVIGPGAMVMIHNPSVFAWGEAEDFRKTADTLDQLRESIVGLYAARTGQSAEDLRAWMDAETWMDGPTALARGFATEIAEADERPSESEPQNAADCDFSPLLSTFKHAPDQVAGLLNRSRMRAARQEKKMKNLLAKLGLSESATEDEAIAALEKRTAFETEVTSLLGESDAGKAVAVVAALKVKADRVDSLQAQLAKIEDDQRKAKIVAMLDEATEDGRLTPANREKLLAEDAPAYARDPAQLATFLDMLPKAAPAPQPAQSQAPQHKSWAEMSNKERAELYEVDRELAEKLRAESEKK